MTKTNLKAKGQAFVVFDDPQSAKQAVEEVHGFQLFNKPISVTMARSKSDKTIELNGTEDDLEAHKTQRLAEKGTYHPVTDRIGPGRLTSMESLEKKKAIEAADEQRGLKRGAGAAADTRPIKSARPTGLKSTSAAAPPAVADEYMPPNNILFIQNVPEDYKLDGLTAIFARFTGFQEVRLVPGRHGIAFVEYDTESFATVAKDRTNGMMLGEKNIKVTYQRK